MNEIREKILAIAYAELGNVDPYKYWLDVLGRWTADHSKGLHWCGAFCLWAFRQVELCSWTWSIDQTKPGFLFRLPRTSAPQPGDVAYFNEPYRHHALVQRVDGDRLFLIQGNYGTPGHVDESECSIKAKKPVFYSIEKLVQDRLELVNHTGQ